MWDTELCNHWDLSPFYNLLSFHNSYFQLLPLPSGTEWGTGRVIERALSLPLHPAARSKFAGKLLKNRGRACVCAPRFLCRRHAFSHFAPASYTVAIAWRLCPPVSEQNAQHDWWSAVCRDERQGKRKQPAPNDLRCLFFCHNKRRHYPTVWIHGLQTASNGCGGSKRVKAQQKQTHKSEKRKGYPCCQSWIMTARQRLFLSPRIPPHFHINKWHQTTTFSPILWYMYAKNMAQRKVIKITAAMRTQITQTSLRLQLGKWCVLHRLTEDCTDYRKFFFATFCSSHILTLWGRAHASKSRKARQGLGTLVRRQQPGRWSLSRPSRSSILEKLQLCNSRPTTQREAKRPGFSKLDFGFCQRKRREGNKQKHRLEFDFSQN